MMVSEATRSFIITNQNPPFVIRRLVDESGRRLTGNEQWTGLSMQLMRELARINGFKFDIHSVYDGQFGTENDTLGSWNGMIGELLNNVRSSSLC